MVAIIRRLGPGDEAVVERLATEGVSPRTGDLLAAEHVIYLVAFEYDELIGFVLAYELLRRHREPTMLFVYDVDVNERHRRSGVATALMRELGRIARERGIAEGFVLTSAANTAAMELYESLGGERPNPDDVMWTFKYEDA